MRSKTTKILSLLLCILLIFQQSGFAQVAGQLDISGHLLQLRNNLIVDKFRPLHLRYLYYNPEENGFKLLLDKGDAKNLQDSAVEQTTKDLLNYFFVGVTVPNNSFWVNLRPDSPDNIIDPALAQTDVGKILLEADLQLKKDTALYTSPRTPEGKVYWDKLYKKAGEVFGYDNVTIPTLTRPWIVPDEIIVREAQDNAYIYKATLKVMLEQDYLKDSSGHLNVRYNFDDPRLKALNEYSSQLIRELIIPKLTKEVNTAKRYASLRQVYYSLILAQWFKARFRSPSSRFTVDSSQNDPYIKLIDSKNLTGLTSKEYWSKATYFQAYQKSFKDGEYNIQEPTYTPYGQTIRSYFSGGITFGNICNSITGVIGGIFPVKTKSFLIALAVTGLLGTNVDFAKAQGADSLLQSVPIVQPAQTSIIPLTMPLKNSVPASMTASIIDENQLSEPLEKIPHDDRIHEIARYDPNNPTIICIHGAIGGQLRDLSGFIKEFLAARYNVYGFSYKEEMNIGEIAKQLRDEYIRGGFGKLDRVTIVANSYGCSVLRKIVYDYPEVFRNVILVQLVPLEGGSRMAMGIAKFEPGIRWIVTKIIDSTGPEVANNVDPLGPLAESLYGPRAGKEFLHNIEGTYIIGVEGDPHVPGDGLSLWQRIVLTEKDKAIFRDLSHNALQGGELIIYRIQPKEKDENPHDAALNDPEVIKKVSDIIHRGKPTSKGALDLRQIEPRWEKGNPYICFWIGEWFVELVLLAGLGYTIIKLKKRLTHFTAGTRLIDLKNPVGGLGLAVWTRAQISDKSRPLTDNLQLGLFNEFVRRVGVSPNVWDSPTYNPYFFIPGRERYDETIGLSDLAGEPIYIHDMYSIIAEKGYYYFWRHYILPEKLSIGPEERIDDDLIKQILETPAGKIIGRPLLKLISGIDRRVGAKEGGYIDEDAMFRHRFKLMSYTFALALRLKNFHWQLSTNTIPYCGASVVHPFELLLQGITTKLYEDVQDRPEEVISALERIEPEITEFALNTVRLNGIKRISLVFGLSLNSSPEYFNKYIEAYILRMIEKFVEAGCEVILYWNGKIFSSHKEDFFKKLPKNGRYILYLGGEEDTARVIRELGKEIPIMGGISPSLLIFGKPDEIRNKVIELRTLAQQEEVVYIPAAGGRLHADAPLENVQALYRASIEPIGGLGPTKGADLSSTPIVDQKPPDGKTGGIDLRTLPIVTQAINNLSANISRSLMNQLASVNLRQEWQDIERMVSAGITPSSERIKEYLQASCAKGEVGQDVDKVINCISDILRSQEEDCSSADPVLKDILVVLESGRSSQDLRAIFTGSK